MYYTVCYFTGIFYAVVRQISMLFIDNRDSVFCILSSQATNYLHYERLGVGLAHEFKLNVPMVHNSLYYLNFFMENVLNYQKIISSQGTLVDLTPPLPGTTATAATATITTTTAAAAATTTTQTES